MGCIIFTFSYMIQSLQSTYDCFLCSISSSCDIIQWIWNSEILILVSGLEFADLPRRCQSRHMSTIVRPHDNSPKACAKYIRILCHCGKILGDFKTKRPHFKLGTPHMAVTKYLKLVSDLRDRLSGV